MNEKANEFAPYIAGLVRRERARRRQQQRERAARVEVEGEPAG